MPLSLKLGDKGIFIFRVISLKYSLISNGSFTPILHIETFEIHKVFLQVPMFVLRQNLSLFI